MSSPEAFEWEEWELGGGGGAGPSKQLQVIEWHMMDKWKFFPLALTTSVSVRALLYPLTVVKTRIQIQRQDSLYRGTWDALKKIRAGEGISGLYKGYWINTFQVFSSVIYVSTYEKCRHILAKDLDMKSHVVRGLIAGGLASAVGQTLIVPFDVVSQHMMMLGNAARLSVAERARLSDPLRLVPRLVPDSVPGGVPGGVPDSASRYRMAQLVTSEIYRQDGLRGFYRGYISSLLCYVPNSGGFWAFYHAYAQRIHAWAEGEEGREGSGGVPQLAVQCVAAPLAGVSCTLLTNPLDLLRARLQVQRAPLLATLRLLWAQERGRLLTKGLSTRLTQSVISALFIVLGYESMKRLSVKEEYKDSVRW